MQTYIARSEHLGAADSGMADEGIVRRLVNSVDEFRAYYDRLNDVKWGAQIAHSGDNQLIHDYGQALYAAEATKRRIEAVTGAWDSIKQWSGLGALPLVPIAIGLGLIAAITAAVATMRTFMKRADITLAMKADSSLTYEQAAAQVDRAHQGAFGRAIGVANVGLLLFGTWLVYKFLKG